MFEFYFLSKNSKIFIEKSFLDFFNNDELCINIRNHNIEKHGGWDYGTCDIACYYLFKLKY